jgi:PAS domain S-box-containing protein
LLFSGKFGSFARAIAVVAPLLLAVDLLFVQSAARALLFSNLLDFVAVFVAAVCSWQAARRCQGFARELWILLAVALSLESIGQALTSYYQTFDRSALTTAIPSDIFFFVWAAPVFMIFLPRTDDDSAEFDWLRTFDFAQVAIVALTMYLYFFYLPSRWRAGEYAVLQEILLLYIARDLLLGGSFYFRSRVSGPAWLRSFCSVMALVFILSACSEAIFYKLLDPSVGPARWGDLFWMTPYVILVFFAVSWRPPGEETIQSSTSRAGRFFAQQFLPIGLPLLVIFMAQAIARQQFLLGWAAVIVSVLCSSARLTLTNRKTRHVAENLVNTEKALRVSEHLLSTAYRSSPDAFSINLFPNGPYLELNEGFTRLTGYTREETLGKSPGQMNLWVDSAERAKALEQIRQTGGIRDLEFQFRTKSGQVRIGQMYASILELNSQACTLVVVRDITARKEAEAILRTNEERFRSLVQHLHVGIAIFDAEARIIFGNRAAVDLLGLPRDQIIGRTSAELGLTPVGEDGSVLPNNQRPVPLVVATGKPIRGFLIGWRRDGLDDVWTLLDAVPEFSSTGDLLRVVVSFTNVTEQRRAIAALRESEERFRTLVSELHVAVVLHQPDGRIEYMNPAHVRMLGLPDVSQIAGKSASELGLTFVAEDGRELKDNEPVSTVIRTRTAVRDALVGIQRVGSDKIMWAFGSSVPHLDANGNLVRVITSFMDMTAHRHAIEALRESEERFRTLVRDLHVGVVLMAPDRRIEFANAAANRMYEMSGETVIGNTPSDDEFIVCDEEGVELPIEERPSQKVFLTQKAVHNFVVGVRRRDSNKTVWIFGNMVPQFDAKGELIRVIATSSDVSQMKNAERAIHQLSTQLMRLQDEERRRLGRELHDGLAQTVLAINLSLAQARQTLQAEHPSARALDKARSLTQQMSREIRTLSYLLHPPLLDELGLVSAVREYVHGFSERSSIDAQLTVLSEFGRLPQEVELALFRIVQESLANIQRHSGSSAAEIRLRQENSSVTLEVMDFGRGMVLPGNGNGTANARLGVGIAGMRERMSQLGGQLEIISASGGTTVRATIAVSGVRRHEDVADIAKRSM